MYQIKLTSAVVLCTLQSFQVAQEATMRSFYVELIQISYSRGVKITQQEIPRYTSADDWIMTMTWEVGTPAIVMYSWDERGKIPARKSNPMLSICYHLHCFILRDNIDYTILQLFCLWGCNYRYQIIIYHVMWSINKGISTYMHIQIAYTCILNSKHDPRPRCPQFLIYYE